MPNGDEGGWRSVPFDARHAQGVQVGQHNVQVNVFYAQCTWADRAPQPPIAAEVSPYRGLSAFEEGDQKLFFGRQRAVAEIVQRIPAAGASQGLMVLSGVSGAGKSSLLRAGVLPEIRRNGLPSAPEAAEWPGLLITPRSGPGSAPLMELAVQVATLAGIDAAGVQRSLDRDPAAFTMTARQAVAARFRPQDTASRGRLLLIVDQWEQVFTQCAEAERRAYLAALAAAAGGPDPAAVVVLAVRADFEARCADYPELARAVQERYLLTAMTETQLRLVITEPARLAGASVTDELVSALLSEVRARVPDTAESGAGVLPLLSHALDQAWRGRADPRVLTLADYERSGGIEAAVAVSASRAYESLMPAQRTVCRQVFLQLTTVNEEGIDTAVGALPEELAAGKDAADVDAVLSAFADERLLTLSGNGVEISHEVLLTAWPLLRNDWLRQTRDDRAAWSQLRERARAWVRSGRDAAYLYRGVLLEAAVAAEARFRAVPDRHPPVAPDEREFLKASIAARRRAQWRLRGVIALLTSLVVALAAATYLVGKADQEASAGQNAAVKQRDIAVSRQLAAQSVALGDKDPVEARLEAAAAWQIATTTQARYALRNAANLPGIAVLPDPDGHQVLAVAFSPGGSLLATGSGSEDASNGAVQLWDAATHLPVGGPLRSAGTRQITALAFGDGGNVLAAGDLSGGVQLWNLRTRRATTLVRVGSGGTVGALAFGPDGILAVGTAISRAQSQVKLWDTATGQPMSGSAAATYSGEVSALAFSPPDGRLLAVGTYSAGVQLWKVQDSRLAAGAMTLPVPAGIGVAFSPDGRTLATSDGNAVNFWDSTTLRGLGQLLDTADPDPVITVAFGKDGATLATGTSTGPARLWDVASRAAIGPPLAGAGAGSPAVAFGPDGVTLAVASTGGTELWNTTRDSLPPANTLPLTGGANSVAFNATTGELAAGDGGGQLHLWDDPGGKPVGLPVNLPRPSAYGVAFSPDGRTIAVTGSGTRLWEASDGGSPAASVERLNSGFGLRASFSPDGKTLAIGGDFTAQVWDVAGHHLLKALSSKPSAPSFTNFFYITPVAFSPDGKLLAVTTDGSSVQLLSTGTYEPVGANIGSPDEIYSLAFSPDSKVLAVGSATGTRLWDTRTRTPVSPPILTGSTVWSMAYSPDGTVLAVGTDSGIQLWDTASGQPIGGTLTAATGAVSAVESLAFSRDGRTLAAGTDTRSSGGVQLWDTSYLIPAATESVVCTQAKSQPLTQGQWAQLAPSIPYQQICPRPVGK